MQFLVVTVEGQQMVMGATFYNASLMEHTNLVSIPDGTQPMGNGYSGTCLHQSFQSVLYQPFTFRIQSRSCLV